MGVLMVRDIADDILATDGQSATIVFGRANSRHGERRGDIDQPRDQSL